MASRVAGLSAGSLRVLASSLLLPSPQAFRGTSCFVLPADLSFTVPTHLGGVSEMGIPRHQRGPQGGLEGARGWEGEGRCDQESSLSQSLLGSGTQVPAKAAPRSWPLQAQLPSLAPGRWVGGTHLPPTLSQAAQQ